MNRTPMRKPIPGLGTFTPFRPKADVSVDQKILLTLTRDLGVEFSEFCDAIQDLEVSKVTANGTGRRVMVKARVLGRAMTMSFAPYEGRERDPRTLGSVADELAGIVARHSLPKAKSQLSVSSMVQIVSNGVHARLRDGEYAGHAVITAVLSREVFNSFRHPLESTGVGRLHRAISEFVSSGGHLGNFDAHQREKAVDNFRQMACHAFKHGASLEDLVRALEEEMVRATMEH